MDLALSGPVRRLDAAHATNGEGTFRWFASAGGIGFDAQVAASMAVRRGWQASRAGYLLTTLAELRRFENRPIRLTVDGEAEDRRSSSSRSRTARTTAAECASRPMPPPTMVAWTSASSAMCQRLTALGQIPNLYRGTHVRHPAVSMRTGATVSLDGDSETRVHLDGEPFGTLPLRVRLVPGALTSPPRQRRRARLRGVTESIEPPSASVPRCMGAGRRRIGTVDAVFADYLLVRTRGLLPDRPVCAAAGDRDGRRPTDRGGDAGQAYERWHRPLKRAPTTKSDEPLHRTSRLMRCAPRGPSSSRRPPAPDIRTTPGGHLDRRRRRRSSAGAVGSWPARPVVSRAGRQPGRSCRGGRCSPGDRRRGCHRRRAGSLLQRCSLGQVPLGGRLAGG